LNLAICDSITKVHYIDIGNTCCRGIFEFMAPQFIAHWHPTLVNNPKEVDKLPIVDCVPLQAIIDETHVFHYDYFSLDVEGAELSILKTIDFAKTTIDFIFVEADGNNRMKDYELVEYLLSKQYFCVKKTGSTAYFAHKSVFSKHEKIG